MGTVVLGCFEANIVIFFVLSFVVSQLYTRDNNEPLHYKLKLHSDLVKKPPVLFLLSGTEDSFSTKWSK